MNLIPMIAKELGVEIGEEFHIKDESGVDEDFHRFTDCGFEYYDQAMCEWQESARVIDLIDGRAEVVKKPFEPKEGERYWYVYWGTEYIKVTDLPFEDDDMQFENPSLQIPINNTEWGMLGYTSEEDYLKDIESGKITDLPF
jgi:hypothetical protein